MPFALNDREQSPWSPIPLSVLQLDIVSKDLVIFNVGREIEQYISIVGHEKWIIRLARRYSEGTVPELLLRACREYLPPRLGKILSTNILE